MRIIKMIPLGELAPDQRGVDSMQMRRSLGLIPVHGAYRSMAKFVECSSKETAYPVNGSLVHLITPDRTNEAAHPNNDLNSSWWVRYGDDSLAPPGYTEALWWRLGRPVTEELGMTMRDLARDGVNQVQKFGLPDLTDPNTDENHFLRFRYKLHHGDTLDSWDVQAALHNGSDDSQIAVVLHDSINNPTLGGWETAEIELITAEVSNIIDYADIQLWVTCNINYPTVVDPLPVDIVAVVSESPSEWAIEGVTGFTKPQVLQDADITTYLERGGAGTKIFEALLADVVEPDNPSSPGTNWSVFVDLGSPTEGLSFDLELLELGEVIHTYSGTTTSGSIQQKTDTIPEATVATITDYTVLSLRLTVDGAGSGSAVTLQPDSTAYAPGWNAVGGSTIHGVTGDDNASTYAQMSAPGTEGAGFKVGLETPGTDPDDGTTITVKARVTADSGRNDWQLEFGSGSDSHFKVTKYNVTGTDTEISAEAAPNGVDWTDAWVIVGNKAWGGERQGSVLEVWVESQEPSTDYDAQVAAIGLLSPTEIAGVSVCFAEYDLPMSEPITPGDQPRIFGGNELSLYEITDEKGFQDVSNTSDASYGALSSPSLSSWQLCSWGNRVIATNGSDPIQWQDGPEERFEDLLDTGVEAETEIFTARFCAVARDFLFFGNCLHDTDTAVNELTLWWSAINNPRLFKVIDLTTMSDYQPLVTTPGSIMQLSGGEHITAFKRSSIYVGTFVGPPLVWDIQVASYFEGTMYSNSVVAIDRDKFFFGNGGFRHLPFGSGVREIGDGKITKMFTDKLYEDRAIHQFSALDSREIENSLVGAYDQWSRLIFWLYRGIEDNAYENKMGIVYNPWQDQWSILDFEIPYSHLNALPCLPSDEGSLTRNVLAFGYKTDENEITYERSLSSTSYQVSIETKILTSAALADAEGKVIHVHGIRPITSLEDSVGTINPNPPALTITVTGALDIHFKNERQQITVATGSDNENDNGWLLFDNPLPGEYFKVAIAYQELEDELLREVLGFEVDCEVGSSN